MQRCVRTGIDRESALLCSTSCERSVGERESTGTCVREPWRGGDLVVRAGGGGEATGRAELESALV